jgi:hypothetical protein
MRDVIRQKLADALVFEPPALTPRRAHESSGPSRLRALRIAAFLRYCLP